MAARAQVLAPHRAIYDINLDQPSRGISEMTGRLVYELSGNACDGYVQKSRFVTRTVAQEGNTSLSDLRTSTWEDAKGNRLRFDTSEYRDEKPAQSTAGEAIRKAGQNGVEVTLSKPGKKVLKLDDGTMFPVQHSIALIEAARDGKSLLQADLFDGSEDGEQFYATTTVIGKPKETAELRTLPDLEAAKTLEGKRAWPINIAFFKKGKGKEDATPDFEHAAIFYENGVSRQLLINFGDFALRGELKALEMLAPGKCDKR